jgi:hypothetical protein
MLILVRNELESSKEWFKSHERNMMIDKNVYDKVLQIEENFADIPLDTLSVYQSQILTWTDATLTSTAWQIFQNSEMIQKMTNKELVIRLAECYSLIGILQDAINTEYWDKKKKLDTFVLDPYQFFDAFFKNKESVYFITVMSLDIDQNFFWTMFPIIDAYIDFTIMLLDKHGDYRYDMQEKDEDAVFFINARIDSVFNARMNSLELKNDTIQ